ncbi:hypothetical protein [Prochlorococcus marinus]|nr:hypothetical protein [Prochlorococcus marinus]
MDLYKLAEATPWLVWLMRGSSSRQLPRLTQGSGDLSVVLVSFSYIFN